MEKDLQEPPTKKRKDEDIKRRKAWSEEEDLQVIELWEVYEPELRKQKRNSHVYSDMSKCMGGKFTAQEVHVKIRNLTQKYRSEKKEIGPSGGSPSTWAYFEKVHRIIGSNASNNSSIMETFEYQTSISSGSTLSSLSSPLPSPSTSMFVPIPEISPSSMSEASNPESTKKKKGNRFEKELLLNLNENIEKQTTQGEAQLGLLQNLCRDFGTFVEQQNENDREFMKILKTLAEHK